METDMIGLNEFCTSHHLEVSFIQSLEDHGLVEIVISDQSLCIYANELPKLERIVRLYRELNINPEGIDVINQLLNRMEHMQHEIANLRNRLSFYEEGNF
jgi:chaperone modulatory protein CbpM